MKIGSVEYGIFLIVLKDREGNPRGVEKAWNGTIFYSLEDAERVLGKLGKAAEPYKIVQASVTYTGVGTEPWNPQEKHKCHDCGVEEGKIHMLGCDMERCPFCGRQLITCHCRYTKLGYTIDHDHPTMGLPEKVYNEGPSEEENARFEDILEQAGRIPYIVLPNMCARCGELWPEMFNVADSRWDAVVPPRERHKMLCRECFDTLEQFVGGWEVLDDYDKKMYEVLTPEGEIVMCWPNAGFFNEVFNGGDESKFKDRKWEVGTIKARLARNHPLGDLPPEK